MSNLFVLQAVWLYSTMKKPLLMVKSNNAKPLGVLRFGLVWAVPPETRNPYPYLGAIFQQKKVPISIEFSKNRCLFLEILSEKTQIFQNAWGLLSKRTLNILKNRPIARGLVKNEMSPPMSRVSLKRTDPGGALNFLSGRGVQIHNAMSVFQYQMNL